MASPVFAFSIASASLKPGLVGRRTVVLVVVLAVVVVNAGMELPSLKHLMHPSCCPLYQIGSIADICGKLPKTLHKATAK